MSQKFRNVFLCTHLLAITLLLFGCDPCKQLAERICQCKNTEEERKQCSSDLSMAKQHQYFKDAGDGQACIEALKKCSCAEINSGEDEECGMYRMIATP